MTSRPSQYQLWFRPFNNKPSIQNVSSRNIYSKYVDGFCCYRWKIPPINLISVLGQFSKGGRSGSPLGKEGGQKERVVEHV